MTHLKRDSCASRMDADKIMRQMLSKYLAVDSYLALLEGVESCNIDESFKKMFNGVCQVRNNSKWRKVYYSLFAELVERRESVTLRDILPELDRRLKRKFGKDRLELSFSSKMLAYLRPKDFPIWDSWVVKNLAAKYGLDLRLAEKGDIKKREEEALRKFDDLTQWATKQLGTREVKKALRQFDARLTEDAVRIPAMKKLDWLLWADRSADESGKDHPSGVSGR